MSVREFEDEDGRRWRAWNINPDSIHPQTKAEDYLADCYQSGWIVFETFDGREKRRLCPYPTGWETVPDARLRELLASAEAVAPNKRAREPRVSAEVPRFVAGAASQEPDLSDLRVSRSFWYPGGRYWSASVALADDRKRPVLRFSAGSRQIDLERWPTDWPDFPDDQLVELLRQAAPRAPGSPPPGVPGRRYTDRGAQGATPNEPRAG